MKLRKDEKHLCNNYETSETTQYFVIEKKDDIEKFQLLLYIPELINLELHCSRYYYYYSTPFSFTIEHPNILPKLLKYLNLKGGESK